MKWLQTNVLKDFGGVSNVVQLLEHEIVTGFKDQAWHAILVRPFGRLLVSADSASMYKQAAFDIAAAIQGSFAKGIRHQDISPFNTAVYRDRVFLTDWSAGKVSSVVASIAVHVQCMLSADIALRHGLRIVPQSEVGLVQVSSGTESPVEDLGKLTMTPLFGAISVLKGFQHSISSHLESLFYSLYYIALGSKMPDAKVFETFQKCDLWWMIRFGAMMAQAPSHLDCIQDSELRSFMLRLHHVFFDWVEDLGCCKYRENVTVSEVQEVCSGGVVDTSSCIPMLSD